MDKTNMPANLPSQIVYEQPLNEHIRFCLRLEHLFKKIEYYLNNESEWGSRTTLETIIEILTVIDRPDIKTKLCKAISLHANALSQLINKQTALHKEIDENKLRSILEQLNELNENLHSDLGKIGQVLRNNEFISTIQQRATTAGGTSAFSTPAYHLWLQQPSKNRIEHLAGWCENFAKLQMAISFILKLTRESVDLEPIQAKDGFYQANLNPNIPYQMIRISMPINENTYPEISVGRHRFSVHFYNLSTMKRSLQITNDVFFDLACCKI